MSKLLLHLEAPSPAPPPVDLDAHAPPSPPLSAEELKAMVEPVVTLAVRGAVSDSIEELKRSQGKRTAPAGRPSAAAATAAAAQMTACGGAGATRLRRDGRRAERDALRAAGRGAQRTARRGAAG